MKATKYQLMSRPESTGTHLKDPKEGHQSKKDYAAHLVSQLHSTETAQKTYKDDLF
jgi:hypothetical protein